MRKLHKIYVRQTYSWKARFVGFWRYIQFQDQSWGLWEISKNVTIVLRNLRPTQQNYRPNMHIHEWTPRRTALLATARRDAALSPNYFGQTCSVTIEALSSWMSAVAAERDDIRRRVGALLSSVRRHHCPAGARRSTCRKRVSTIPDHQRRDADDHQQQFHLQEHCDVEQKRTVAADRVSDGNVCAVATDRLKYTRKLTRACLEQMDYVPPIKDYKQFIRRRKKSTNHLQ